MSPRYVILVAGGKGLRMGGDVPKQFMPIGGKPVLMHTIERFRQVFSEINIILVLPVEQQSYWQQLCEEYDFRVPMQVANGGQTRFHSVQNGLKLIPRESGGLVGVHDGVRPFVFAETVLRCYEAAETAEAVVPVVPVVETLRQLDADGGSHTVSRDSYCLVQTPQVFSVSLLHRAYEQDYTSHFTDDASVVEAMGGKITLVEGNRENIKLTTPADILMAEALLGEKDK